jgi:hypothetical protein
MVKCKLCIWCGVGEAAVPANRSSMKFRREICSTCHARRLRGDLIQVLIAEAKKYREIKHGN